MFKAVSVVLMLMAPCSSVALALSSSSASCICTAAEAMREYSSSPSGVKVTPRLERMNSTQFSWLSSRFMAWVMLGWLLPSTRAARVKF